MRDADPLDSRLAPPVATAERGPGSFTPALTDPHTRTLALLPIGFVLGPSGMALLSSGALAFLDPLVSVASTLVGVLLGLALLGRHPPFAEHAGAALLESTGTVILVAGGIAGLHVLWGTPGGVPWTAAVLLGVCACASFAPATSAEEPHTARRVSIGDLDSTIAAAAGAAVLAFSAGKGISTMALAFGSLMLIALAIAGAGWLLVGSAASDRERHTFVAGTLLLLGGSAAYLGHSALLVGLLAGAVWASAGGAAGERIVRDVQHVRHPLIVLLLVAAGAHLTVTTPVLVLALVYVACRTVAKRGGELLVGRAVATAGEWVRGGTATLMAPGIVGIAIAMDGLQSSGPAAEAAGILSTVAIASLTIDAVGLMVRRTAGAP